MREIGRGGMGSVLEATDPVLGRVVAVKRALSTEPETIDRFAREFRLTARLEHPAIVPVYDAGTTSDGVPFYVMRKVSGRPLGELIAVRVELDERLALLPNLLAAVQAVAHAHQRGIIHRDLKPANILVGELGETIVIDWGLARELDASDAPAVGEVGDAGEPWVRTRVGTVMGTPGYMAPEQQRTSDVDARADVYALGATLHTVLAGKPPGQAGLPSGVSAELAAIVAKATADDPELRYRDAAALAEELQRFLTGRVVAAHRYTARERVMRFARRHRAALTVAGAALAVLAVGAVLAIQRVVDARDEAVRERNATELARAREAERADELVIGQAQLLVATNPAQAVAMVRPLIDGPHWQEARSVVATARANGLPWRYAVTGAARWVGVSPDGLHAVVASDAGTAVLDLRAHAVHALPPVHADALEACDGDRLVGSAGAKLVTVDLGSGRQTEVELARPITSFGCAGADTVVVLDDGSVGQLRAGATALQPIAVADTIRRVVVSPDAARVALAGAAHLWDLEVATGRARSVAEGKVGEIAFASDPGQLVAIAGGDVVRVAWPGPQVTRHPAGDAIHVAAAREVVFHDGYGGLRYRADLGDRQIAGSVSVTGDAHPAPFSIARDDVVVTWNGATLELFDAAGGIAGHPTTLVNAVDLPSPLTPIERVATSRRGPFVVAVAAGEVLVWNLDDVLPRRFPFPTPGWVSTAPIAGTAIAASDSNGVVRRIDLATGKISLIRELSGLVRYDQLGAGAAIALDAQHRLWWIHPDGAVEPILPGPVAGATLADPEHVAVALASGEIVLVELATRQVRHLFAIGATPVGIVATPDWVVVRAADDKLWRVARETLAVTSIMAGTVGPFCAPSADGSVVFARDGALVAWNADGSVVHRTAVREPILGLVRLGRDRVWILSETHVFGESHTAETHGTASAIRTTDGNLIVYGDDSRRITVLDGATGMSWQVAGRLDVDARPYGSSDGSMVYAVMGAQLWVWDLGRPATAQQTAAWADRLTNARWDAAHQNLTWR